MGKRELVALLSSSFWCLVDVVWLFLVVPSVCLQFLIVEFPHHTHYFCDGVIALGLRLRLMQTLYKLFS